MENIIHTYFLIEREIKMGKGTEEGSICCRDECDGTMVLEDIESCSCHIVAPCAGHVNQKISCDKCGGSEDE